MAKVRRFYFVASRRSRSAHMATSITEGNRTYCGILIRLGWVWARQPRAAQWAKLHKCKKCLHALKEKGR